MHVFTPANSSEKLLPQNETHPHILPKGLSLAFAGVLEDTVDKLMIISNIGGFPHVDENNGDEIIEKTFEENQKKGRITFEQHYETFHYNQRLVLVKKNINFVIKILKETVVSLINENNFDCLVKKIKEFKEISDSKKRFVEEVKESREKLDNLKMTYDDEKREVTHLIQIKSEEIGKVKDDIENMVFENGVKMSYLDKWEKSRTELNDYVINTTTGNYLNKIKDLTGEIEKEKRVNEEILKLIAYTQSGYEDQIQKWMGRFDTETKLLDLDIAVMKERIETKQLHYIEIKKTYDEHKLFVEKWSKYKENKRKDEEKRRVINEAAIKIQSWWRGVMVRQKLGPYGKKKKTKQK